jgi:hypothetical protein
MAATDPLLPALDALAMAAVLQANRLRWKWDDKHAALVIGKLTRGNPVIRPLEREAVGTIVSMCREGWGLRLALKQAGVSERRYFAWVAKAHSEDPDAGPYRAFRDELVAAFAQCTATTGIEDPDSLRQLAELALT